MTSCPGQQPDRNARWKPPRNSITLPSYQLPEPTVSDKAGALPCLLVLGGPETGGVKASGLSLALLG